jgi:hypothetical protein
MGPTVDVVADLGEGFGAYSIGDDKAPGAVEPARLIRAEPTAAGVTIAPLTRVLAVKGKVLDVAVPRRSRGGDRGPLPGRTAGIAPGPRCDRRIARVGGGHHSVVGRSRPGPARAHTITFRETTVAEATAEHPGAMRQLETLRTRVNTVFALLGIGADARRHGLPTAVNS